MPGICGITDQTASQDLAHIGLTMLEKLQQRSRDRVESSNSSFGDCWMGRVSLGVVNSGAQPVEVTASDSRAVLDGEIYNVKELLLHLNLQSSMIDPQNHAEILLHGYLKEGRGFFARVEGKFAAAIWDGRHDRLLLVNDRFGMKPLYFTRSGRRLQFASEIKALLAAGNCSTDLNMRGLAQFFTFGHLWCQDTFYAAIQTLPAAACITFEPNTGALEVERYWQLQSQVDRVTNARDQLDQVDRYFKESVDRCSLDTPHLGLSLSGGLDARSILAVMDHHRVNVQSVCLGIEGSLDLRSASELARLAGSQLHPYILNDRFLTNFETHLDAMVHLTDGHYLSQCIVMPTLPVYEELGIQVLLRGHAGELMHMRKAYNFSLDAEAKEIRQEQQLQQWLSQRLQAYMLDGLDQPLFACMDSGEVQDLAQESLREALEESSGWQPQLHRIWHLFLTQRLRRETAMSLVKINSVTETRIPYLSADLVQTLLTLPPDRKLDELIQQHIMQKRFPEFLGVTNVNTGAKVGAGRLSKFVGYGRMRVLAKLGVKGYQPYERLGLWLRRELRTTVECILLDDRCLERGVFRPETVQKVVREHQGNTKNHTFLLMAMMIFELGQRKFVDQRSSQHRFVDSAHQVGAGRPRLTSKTAEPKY